MTESRSGPRRPTSAARSMAKAAYLALPRRTRIEIMHLLGRRSPWEPGVVLPPPDCPDGMVVGPPDFVGVGVQKAGTSWWYSMMCEHERVHHPPGVPKELHFFMRFFGAEMTSGHIDEYSRWFPRPPGFLAGEWTPDYLAAFWVPALLHAAAPKTKILVLLRDPVDRWVSGLTHRKRLEPVLDWRGAVEAFGRGQYAPQLASLKDFFPDEQLLVLQYERCQIDGPAQLARTFDFLGLQDPAVAPRFDRAVNHGDGPKVTLPPDVKRELVRGYTMEVTALADAHPDIDLALWPNFAHLVRR